MRRGFWPLRIGRRALPVLALAVSAAPCAAQALVCDPIRPGESAAQAARRITGNGRSLYSASFQIVNGSAKLVPKSQYDRVQPGWSGCMARAPRRTLRPRDTGRASDISAPQAPAPAAAVVVPAAIAAGDPVIHFRVSAEPAKAIPARGIDHVDLTMLWLGTAIAAPWFGFRVLDRFMTRRKTASVMAQQFANRFIAEFERPLLRDHDTEGPLKTRVRRARRGRFDILLAPGPQRRYPNLTDHKRNVEYDVDRVLHALDDPAFIAGEPYTQAEWVVVPFQPAPESKQSGITCISSS
jgi:hypothetical protein